MRQVKIPTPQPKYIIEPVTTWTIACIFVRFLDAWIAMLALGAIGHRQGIAMLLRISYWDALLGVLVIQSLAPTNVRKLKIRKPKKGEN